LIWDELGKEFPNVFNMCSVQSLWVAARTQEMKRPLTPAERKRRQEGNAPRETIAEERLCPKRPDGIAIKRPTKIKSGVFCILESKRMSDVADQYIGGARQAAEDQYASYASLRTALSNTLRHQGWVFKESS